MSFFYSGNHASLDSVRGISFETLHAHGCNLCPLNHQNGYQPKHKQIPAHGAEHPVVYGLGEAPGEEESEEGLNFVGRAGQYLRKHIPYRWESKIRWNNVVRTRPVEKKKGGLTYVNATPTTIAIEACRMSVQADIEQSKPQAIFGFGNIPLHWTIGQNGIRMWNGRRVPVKIGTHTCWYFPLLHPSYVLHLDNENTRKLHEQMAFVFELDLRRAFQAVEKGLPPPHVHTREEAEQGIDCLYDLDSIAAGLDQLKADKVVGIDLETIGTRPYGESACILSCALSGRERAIAFPLYHSQANWSSKELATVEDLLLDFLHSYKGRKISFSLHFELEWLAYFYGNDLVYSGRWGDAQAQAFLMDQRWEGKGALSLNFVCLNHFGLDIKAITNTDKENLDQTPLDTVLTYNAIDARYHRKAHIVQDKMIDDQGLREVYEHHVHRTQAAVLLQLKGVPIVPEVTEKLADKYEGQIAEIEQGIDEDDLAKKFKDRYGHAYRPSAAQDTKNAFRLIGTHLDNAQESEIEKIDHPLAKLHLRWKEANKILSTYINPCRIGTKDSAVWPDGFLHPILHLARVRTWRSSTSEPGVQNWPKHFGEAHEVRDQVQAPIGHKIVSFDYGQIQARNVAMESKDKALVQSFWDRYDIHADWRDRVFDLYPQWADIKGGLKKVLHDPKLMKWFRNRAKNEFVFASFFEAGGRTVAKHMGVPEDIGYQLAEEFDDAFPEVAQWHDDLHAGYEQNGYVTGLSGFRRYAPVSHTEVVNTPIQSDEAVIVFDSMIRLCEMQEPRFVPFLMIHDDNSFIWPDKEIERNAEVVIDTMLNCPFEWTRIVPISVEISVGQSWDHMEEISSYGLLESDTWTGKLKKA